MQRLAVSKEKINNCKLFFYDFYFIKKRSVKFKFWFLTICRGTIPLILTLRYFWNRWYIDMAEHSLVIATGLDAGIVVFPSAIVIGRGCSCSCSCRSSSCCRSRCRCSGGITLFTDIYNLTIAAFFCCRVVPTGFTTCVSGFYCPCAAYLILWVVEYADRDAIAAW